MYILLTPTYLHRVYIQYALGIIFHNGFIASPYGQEGYKNFHVSVYNYCRQLLQQEIAYDS